jgi:hypothetical protein
LYCDKDKFSICVGKAERIAPYNKEVWWPLRLRGNGAVCCGEDNWILTETKELCCVKETWGLCKELVGVTNGKSYFSQNWTWRIVFFCIGRSCIDKGERKN